MFCTCKMAFPTLFHIFVINCNIEAFGLVRMKSMLVFIFVIYSCQTVLKYLFIHTHNTITLFRYLSTFQKINRRDVLSSIKNLHLYLNQWHISLLCILRHHTFMSLLDMITKFLLKIYGGFNVFADLTDVLEKSTHINKRKKVAGVYSNIHI